MGELDGIKRAQIEAAIHAGEVWANHVLGIAQQIAPLEEGTLAASGQVQTTRTPDGAEIVMSFSTVYAARQHEELTWDHREGRQAKYLEEPFKRELRRLEPVLTAAVARAVK